MNGSLTFCFRRWLPRVFVALVSTVLAGWAFGGVGAPAQGGLLVAVSVVFTVADFFLWKTLDSLGDLPNAPELTHIEAGRLSAKIEDLRGRLISRWFFMLGAKLAVAAMGVLLMKEVAVGVPLQWFWWGGVFLIFLSLQMALTFVSNWRQADKAKRMGVLDARRKKEIEHSLEAQRASQKEPFAASPVTLAGYTEFYKPEPDAPKRPKKRTGH